MNFAIAPDTSESSAWMGPASYWMPAHMPVSAWIGHAPFASWLVSALKPRSIVELGTHFGFSYFVFCEAVLRLGLECTARALDTWQGDDQAGFYGDDVFEYVARTNTSHYVDFSTLVRGLFDDSLALVPDASVDLLHIDGRHGFDDVTHDFEAWLPKMSPQGVVLFHDTAERQPGFGVWRFWEDVAQRFPSLAFQHSHGLGVLGVGDALPPAMLAFFTAASRSPNRILTSYEKLALDIERFDSMGRSARQEADIRARLEVRDAEYERAQSQIEQLLAEIQVLQGSLVRSSACVEGLTQQLDALHRSTSWTVTRPLRAIGSKLHR